MEGPEVNIDSRSFTVIADVEFLLGIVLVVAVAVGTIDRCNQDVGVATTIVTVVEVVVDLDLARGLGHAVISALHRLFQVAVELGGGRKPGAGALGAGDSIGNRDRGGIEVTAIVLGRELLGIITHKVVISLPFIAIVLAGTATTGRCVIVVNDSVDARPIGVIIDIRVILVIVI